MKGKKILVTGAAGFIGSNLVESLIKDNFVIGVDNLSSGKKENLRDFLESKNFAFKKIDVKDTDLLKKEMDGVDLVFHLSANASSIAFLTASLLSIMYSHPFLCALVMSRPAYLTSPTHPAPPGPPT